MKLELDVVGNLTVLDASSKARYHMASHWFWPQFVNGWEPQTFRFYERYVVHGMPVVDVGSWVGPTALLACWFGASRVRLVEANPVTVDLLKQSMRFDKALAKRWEIEHACVAPQRGEVSFGVEQGALTASSAASDRGTGAVVTAKTYADVLAGIDDPAIIKIDIEGSESKIMTPVLTESPPGAAIWLSWHPPFWQDAGWLDEAVRLLYERYWVFDSELKPLPQDTLLARAKSTEAKPVWGTPYGNFFETSVLSKQRFTSSGLRRLS